MQPKKETKAETFGPIAMFDQEGNEYRVTCSVRSYRQQFLDGTWTEWNVETRRFMCGRTPVNPRDDGWYELAIPGTLIRPPQED